MEMPSLFEDCQAWIDKGLESWKSYISKWEAFATYEETLIESELVHKLNGKHKERKNGNKEMLRQRLCRKRLKTVSLKNKQSRLKKVIKNKKRRQKSKAEIRNQMLCGSLNNENLSEIIENKQLEITLTTFFKDLKANANMSEMFTILFQTFTDRELTIKDPDYLSPKQQVLPTNDLETNLASPSFANQHLLSLSLPKNNLNERSICPAREVYLQSLNESQNKIHLKQMQSKCGQWGSPRIAAQSTSMFETCNFSKPQFLTLNASQVPLSRQNLEVRNYPPLSPTMFGYLKPVQFDFSPKFPSNIFQNKEYLRNATISKMDVTQEYKSLGNSCAQCRTKSISLSLYNNTNFITPQRKLSEQRCLNEVPSQRRQTPKKSIFDIYEDDSDSDDQTKYHSPIIRCQNKRLKADETSADALESDTDDCDDIFDRIVKS